MASYATAILAQPSLVNYWKLGESSGPTAADSKGSFPLTYGGSTIFGQPGPGTGQGTAIDCSTFGVAMANAGSNLTAPYTIECWVKVASTTAVGAAINSRKNTPINATELRFSAHKIGALIGDGGTTWYTTTMASPLSYDDGIWHHVVLTVTTTLATLYVDGASVTTASYSGTPKLYVSGLPFQLGSYTDANEYLPGLMNHAAVYNTALSAPTVLANYNAMFVLPTGSPAALLPMM